MPELLYTQIRLPLEALKVDMEQCLGDSTDREIAYLRNNFIEMYAQLKATWNSGMSVIARREAMEDDPKYLSSLEDLHDEMILINDPESNVTPLTCIHRTFDEIMEGCHTEREMREFYKTGKVGKALLAEVAHIGAACSWRYMDRILEGRRIGSVNNLDGSPDLGGFFQEFKNLKRVFPRYNEFVSYALESDKDRVLNSEREESVDLFLDRYVQFQDALKQGDPEGMAAASEILRGYD